MERFLDKISQILDQPLRLRSRVLVLIGVLLLIPAYIFPLWKMTLYSIQYTQGLRLNIYAYKLEGGRGGNDLQEINTLNHYIGMKPLEEEDFTEFKWIPFVIGIFIILSLRAAVMGKISFAVDLLVMFTYFGLFALWSFYYKLYSYGHNLDPRAAVKVEPFTPGMIGHTKLAQFDVYSYPGPSTYTLLLFGLVLAVAIYMSLKPALATVRGDSEA
jgi:hypothetical protein